MTTDNQNFQLRVGEYKKVTVTITGTGSNSNLTVADVATMVWYVNKVAKKSLALGTIVLTDVTPGVITAVWEILPADTTGMQGVYHHYLWAVDILGRPVETTAGTMTVKVK